jgi:hypothetical protein
LKQREENARRIAGSDGLGLTVTDLEVEGEDGSRIEMRKKIFDEIKTTLFEAKFRRKKKRKRKQFLVKSS